MGGSASPVVPPFSGDAGATGSIGGSASPDAISADEVASADAFPDDGVALTGEAMLARARQVIRMEA
ncbi:MAG TPA: hypothetical protein VFE05_24085, partial [Longimicrobiaceae bacterium]|nr:hypothetical protein [Longimicrobiaceae bacterium]